MRRKGRGNEEEGEGQRGGRLKGTGQDGYFSIINGLGTRTNST